MFDKFAKTYYSVRFIVQVDVFILLTLTPKFFLYRVKFIRVKEKTFFLILFYYFYQMFLLNFDKICFCGLYIFVYYVVLIEVTWLCDYIFGFYFLYNFKSNSLIFWYFKKLRNSVACKKIFSTEFYHCFLNFWGQCVSMDFKML